MAFFAFRSGALAIASLLVLYPLRSTAQECATEEVNRPMEEARARMHRLDRAPVLKGAGSISIPIVVHVVHLGEPVGTGSNVSDSLIMAGVACANDRFSGTLGAGPDMGISFCFAQITPDGQPTNGIDRVDGTAFPGFVTEGLAYDPGACGGVPIDTLANAVRWPGDRYYNIYMIHGICGANVSGFAYYPSSSYSNNDGTYLESPFMTVCYSTVLAHELGHGMGLYHTFEGDWGGCPQNTDCTMQGDWVCDTPPHTQTNCLPGTAPCDTANSLWPNSVYNYMSYCGGTDRFTPGQGDRMHAECAFYRADLLTSTACFPDSCIATSTGYDRHLHASPLGGGDYLLTWLDNNADSIDLRFRPVGSPVWMEITAIDGDSLVLNALPGCALYEFELQVWCDGSPTGYGDGHSWTTYGCVPCDDESFCTSRGLSYIGGWIHSFTLDGQQFVTGMPLLGYTDLTDSGTITLQRGQTYALTIEPGPTFFPPPENFKAWIDFDADALFNDSTELIFVTDSATTVPVTKFFTVPPDAVVNTSRMRVVSNADAPPLHACQTVPHGETEDLCVTITDISTSIAAPRPPVILNVVPNPFHDAFTVQLPQGTSMGGFRVWDLAGKLVLMKDQRSPLIATNALVPGPYVLELYGTQGEPVGRAWLMKW